MVAKSKSSRSQDLAPQQSGTAIDDDAWQEVSVEALMAQIKAAEEAQKQATWNPKNQEQYHTRRRMVQHALDEAYQKEGLCKPLLEIGAGSRPMFGPGPHFFATDPNPGCAQLLEAKGYESPRLGQTFDLIVSRNVWDVVLREGGVDALKALITEQLGRLNDGGQLIAYHDLTLYGSDDSEILSEEDAFICKLEDNFAHEIIRDIRDYIPEAFQKYYINVSSVPTTTELLFSEPSAYSFSHQLIKVNHAQDVIRKCLERTKGSPKMLSLITDLKTAYEENNIALLDKTIHSLMAEPFFWQHLFSIFQEFGDLEVRSQYDDYIQAIQSQFPELSFHTDIIVHNKVVRSSDVGGYLCYFGKYPDQLIVESMKGERKLIQQVAILKIRLLHK